MERNDAEPLLVIGLMSGTSMDGIDIACLETNGMDVARPVAHLAVAYSASRRKAIERGLEEAKSITERGQRPGGLAALEQELTSAHSEAVKTFLALPELAGRHVDLIGFHGQTVLHRPEKGLTVQLGDGQALVLTL